MRQLLGVRPGHDEASPPARRREGMLVDARRLLRMSPNLASHGSVRSAAAVNEAIRALVRGAVGRRWTVAERALYGLLLEEWAAAERAEVVEAA